MSAPAVFAVFTQRKMAAILLLGFSAGLPLLLTGRCLQTWTTRAGLDLKTVGFISLVALPYSLKFLIAPFFDRFALPMLGRRRGWLLVLQIAVALAILVLSRQDPALDLTALVAAAVAVAWLSACQDIVVDAHRADVLGEREVGAGVAGYVLGYRLALVVSGSLGIWLAPRISWPDVYLLMAGAMGLGLIGTLLAPEAPDVARPMNLRQAVVDPFVDFFRRKGWATGGWILVFAVFYKLGDALAGNMVTPFLLRHGYTEAALASVQGVVGIVATVLGVVAGGGILAGLGLSRSLWVFGLLQALSNLGYAAVALMPVDLVTMGAAVVVENFCGGLGTAAFVGFLMSLCNPRFSATQYALLTSLMAAGRDVLAAPAGAMALHYGWPLFFVVSGCAALPGLLLLARFAPWSTAPPSPPLGRDAA